MSSNNDSDSKQALGAMAAHWVKSQAVVAAYINSNVFDSHSAEDIIQETAIAAAQNFMQFDNQKPFTPWVLGIAKNQVLKYYRTKSKEDHLLSEQALTICSEAFERIEDQLEARRDALKDCLKKVKGKSAKVLMMRYEADMHVKDIGKELSLSPSTISVMLFRVRSMLESCIRSQLGAAAR